MAPKALHFEDHGGLPNVFIKFAKRLQDPKTCFHYVCKGFAKRPKAFTSPKLHCEACKMVLGGLQNVLRPATIPVFIECFENVLVAPKVLHFGDHGGLPKISRGLQNV